MGRLVRDRIPAIIRASGEDAHVRVLSPEDYLPALLERLVEAAIAAQEAGVDDLLDGLVDVDELVRAIVSGLGWEMSALAAAATRRVDAEGAFTARLWLE